jgi:diguanylate cyclase (GGDEF)-like protein
MLSLDVKTILFMTALMCAAMAVVMYAMHRSFRREVQGLGHWAAGLALMVAAGALFALQGAQAMSPSQSTLVQSLLLMLANLALVCGIGLSMIGTRAFYGQPPAWRLWHAMWMLDLLSMLCWLIIVPNFSLRAAAFSFIVSVCYIDQLSQVWQRGERHFVSWFFGVLLALQTIAVLTRGVAALTVGAPTVDLLRNSGLANAYLAVSNFMALLLTVGFLMLATRRLQRVLEKRSTHDPLTEVLNRRGFGEAYTKARARQRRGAGTLALMAIDLDHFKAVNDKYGHVEGDRVLVKVAGVICRTLRENDSVARFGGEEFIVLLPETSLARASQVAERIQALLGQTEQPCCTVSIGIASQAPGDESIDSLLSRADAALYRAKGNGRNRVEIAEAAVLIA